MIIRKSWFCLLSGWNKKYFCWDTDIKFVANMIKIQGRKVISNDARVY